MIRYRSKSETFADAWNELLRNLPRVQINNRSEIIIIALYASRNMRVKNELKLQHLGNNDAAHYALIKLDIPKSIATVLDSLQTDFKDSEYFPTESIEKIITELYDFFRSEQGFANRVLVFDQVKFQGQFANDCGPNMLVNAELILTGKDPALQQFTKSTMEDVRYYHALLYSDSVKMLRLYYNDL